MANKIVLKKSSVVSKVPLAADLDIGELAVNLADQKLYSKNASGTVILVGSGLGGSGDVQGPASSTDNAIARFNSTTGKIIKNSAATIDDSGNLTALSHISSGTGADKIPSGTTAQRPASPQVGHIRYNTTESKYEVYTTGGWQYLSTTAYPILIEYLVIAGGGGGRSVSSGGGSYGMGAGGGGGYRSSISGEFSGGGASAESVFAATPGTAYTVTVGAGGPNTNNGSNSVFATITSLGGGSYSSGGSGGGGDFNGAATAGTTGQGYAGAGGTSNQGGGGGGSRGAGGFQGGGVGAFSSVTGTSIDRAGGGGGGNPFGSGGSASAGGGAGGSGTQNGIAGTANTGGGGGGASIAGSGAANGGQGGSGVIMLKYSSSLTPTISAGLTYSTTTVGANKVTTFTAGTGTITF